jgi:hypothetical protein
MVDGNPFRMNQFFGRFPPHPAARLYRFHDYWHPGGETAGSLRLPLAGLEIAQGWLSTRRGIGIRQSLGLVGMTVREGTAIVKMI